MIYIRESTQEISVPFMSDGAYVEARQSLPFVATDAVIYDSAKQVLHLAWRSATPARGWWVIGGGVKNGQSPDVAMSANFRRETSLSLPSSRFSFLDTAINMTQWTKQEQISNLHLPYGVQLTADELATISASLDKKEYTQSSGLQPFSLTALMRAIEDGTGYPQPVLYYDAIFSTNAFPGALKLWQDRQDESYKKHTTTAHQ